ncbi:MAG: lipopolysaccharide kinase InaA family protein [Tannerella sp.]|jgi:serine/threonine protein kinase|nr:lipopolysaccharide kinase InaA family protein [Tannerella sp.]
MKVVINPQYDYLRGWIEKTPCFFEKEGEVIHNKRNVIKVFRLDDGTEMNVKRYGKPHLFNRIVYSFFRKSKAYRAYHNALRISGKGFATAEPVAYMEMDGGGLLSLSYYISLQCRHVREIREYYFGPLAGNETLIDAFARYSASLHDAGIYHLDYSPGNILIREDTEGSYTFILIDTNRMKFMPVSTKKGCRNFARLFGNDDIYKRIGTEYARSRKKPFAKEEAVRLMMKYKNRFLQKKEYQKRAKKFLFP